MRLLTSTIVLNLFFALFLSAQIPDPDGWGAVRLYGHAFENRGFSEKQLDFIAQHHSIMTVEKRHGKYVYGRGRSESATLKAARKLSKHAPESKVLFYWNALLVYDSLYESLRGLPAREKTWFKKSSYGVESAPYEFDFTTEAARELWVSVPTRLVADPNVDGVFIDAVPKAELSGQISVVREMMEALPGLVIYNGYRYYPRTKEFLGGGETLKHADGVFVEAFMSGSVDRADRAERLIDALLEVDPEKILICNGLKDGFGSQGGHQFSLGAYLIVAHENSYFRFGEGHAFGGEFLTFWHEDFSKKIGKPLGEVKKAGRVYRRSFENLEVMIDLDNQEVELDWK